MIFDIIKETKAEKTFRVASVIGKFDLQNEHIREHFQGEIDLSKDWQIGCIVGNSGTGKTTIAKELFGKEYITNFKYKSKSILDDFPKELTIDDITKTFNSVGFSSPPSWLKPYEVLSQGEKMRVDLARAILNKNDLIVFDEFTSTVDRNVAKIGSAAISKSIKRTKKKFIAVSCHSDILEWLEPDWIFDTNKMEFDYIRGSLQRPNIEVKIYERKGMWNLFRKYHYLDSKINNASKQFVAFINNAPVAFCAVLHFPHPIRKNVKRCTRLVVLPDYQGLGIGNRLLNYIAENFIKKGFVFRITTTTPALINSFGKNEHWRLDRVGRIGGVNREVTSLNKTISSARYTTSWEYICN